MNENNKNTRKRGDQLTESIYDATLNIIKEVGYSNLTFMQIAKEAKTSRTVLYRRWSNTFELLHEIMEYKVKLALDGQFIDKIEDTGSLRGDLYQLLTLYQKVYIEVGLEIMNALLFEVSQNNVNISLFKTNANNSNILIMKKILEFAKTRGDKIKNVSDMTLILPFDLIRMKYLIRKDIFDKQHLEILVDEILLPVFMF